MSYLSASAIPANPIVLGRQVASLQLAAAKLLVQIVVHWGLGNLKHERVLQYFACSEMIQRKSKSFSRARFSTFCEVLRGSLRVLYLQFVTLPYIL
jgi:hypothetical protein